ncbi:MAG: tetratricopeptide repeat protein, partial [Bryobacteraceae bacterium]
PVAGVGLKVDQMSTEFSHVRESVADLVSRMGRLEQKLTDLGTAVRTINTPPPPPSGDTGAPTASGTPPMPADTLYDYAYRDKLGGKVDIAMAGFMEYLKYYADTDKAPNAQFWIGQIYFDKGEMEDAVKHFELTATKYPENNKTADAMYMKGQALLKLNRRDDAVVELRAAYGRFPKSEAAPKACGLLKGLGLACTGTAQKKKK